MSAGLVEQHAGQQQAPGILVQHLLDEVVGGGWRLPHSLPGVPTEDMQSQLLDHLQAGTVFGLIAETCLDSSILHYKCLASVVGGKLQ